MGSAASILLPDSVLRRRLKYDLAEIEEIERIRKSCPRFRVLVIGRANSGKTTIIQKMCDTKEAPVVRDQEGIEHPASVLEDPDAMRGTHDIYLEITYKSNPLFIFHDSMGFEAGGTEELEKVKDFIKQMLEKTELRDRLHAIWYCIPTDSDRVASKAELSFFQENIGNIPVILLFTKWDGQIIKACNTLRFRERMEKHRAIQEAPQRAKKVLEEQYIPVFMNAPCPPTSYTVLGDMHKPETKCNELSEKTAAALDNTVLKKLFVSVQTHNIQLCMMGSIDEAIFNGLFSASTQLWSEARVVLCAVLSWFPHILLDQIDYSRKAEQQDRKYFEYSRHEYTFFRLFEPALSSCQNDFASLRLQLLHVVASSAIIATHSLDLKRPSGTMRSAFKTSITQYLESPQRIAVKTAIHSKFHQYTGSSPQDISNETMRIMSEDMKKICLDNLLKSG